MTVTVLQYGRYEHGRAYRSGEGRGWFRRDVYRSDGSPDLDGNSDRLFAAGRADDSPIFQGQYDGARCSCCYLGFAHTVAKHEAAIAAHVKACGA